MLFLATVSNTVILESKLMFVQQKKKDQAAKIRGSSVELKLKNGTNNRGKMVS